MSRRIVRHAAIDGLLGPGEVVARLTPAGAHLWSVSHPVE